MLDTFALARDARALIPWARTLLDDLGNSDRPVVSLSEWASHHFKWEELECRCGCGARWVQEEALMKLERLRVALGVPFSPNSACRCPAHNRAVGGVSSSQHISTPEIACTAFDIPIRPGAPKERIIREAEAVGFRGIGANYRTFVHVDNRPLRARW